MLTLAQTTLKLVLTGMTADMISIIFYNLHYFISFDKQHTGRPPCGRGATCKATRYKAVCSCPRDHTVRNNAFFSICLIDLICPIQGDPFVSCRPFTPEDLCRPNPCGANAYCESAFPVDKVEILHQEVNNLYKTVFFFFQKR